MKKSLLGFVLIVVILVSFFGCATSPNRQVSSYAFTQPEQAVSVPAPVQMAKNGVKYVTVFTAILDAGVWGVEGVNGAGVWPALALQNGNIHRGYVFVTDLNWWGDFVLQGCVEGQISDPNAKIIYLNRDGGWVYDLTSKESNYIPAKFSKDKSYEAQIFTSAGSTLADLDRFWLVYSEKRGTPIESGMKFSKDIRVGTPEWDEFKKNLIQRMSYAYQMPGGEIREGFMSIEDFRREAAKNYGLTAGQRFRKQLRIPAGVDPISVGAGVAGTILNGILAANQDSWTGFYARADALRKDLKPQFRLMQKLYKQLLMQRDAVIYQLQQERRQP